MTEKRVLPKFAGEAEEADWWFEHADDLMDDFKAAAAEGRLGRGTTARLAGIPTATIELDPADFEMARELAQKRGLRYQTYLHDILHEALLRDAKAS